MPPTTTSHLQPLDVGIIQCFKGHYRRQHLRHLVDWIDNDAPQLVSLKDAVRYVKCAWDEVSSNTIENCWVHIGLVERDRDTSQVELLRNSTNEDELLLSHVYSDLDVDPELQMTVQ